MSRAAAPSDPPSRLARRLGVADAVVVGLGAMVGAGVFAAFAPAAAAAGNGLLLALLLAAAVAYCNAKSSATLAAAYPESGGAYAYGRHRLGPFWGFLAGWGFVVGKLASCAAMALTFAHHAAPSYARPLAVAAVVVLTAIDYVGIERTVRVTRVLLGGVFVALAIVVASVWLGGAAEAGRLWPLRDVTPSGVLEAAGFLFFAFAGYARIATLGEEVRDPARTLQRAIPLALALALALYAVVAITALAGAGVAALAASDTPLALAVEQGRWHALAPVVRAGAALASLGVLLSLIAGIGRTMFAMAANGDLPAALAAVHPRYRVPHRAELAAGAIVAVAVALADLRSAIGFSSFAVLFYYGIANAAAWTLDPRERGTRVRAAIGIAGCALLAFALPRSSVLAGSAVLAAGALLYATRRSRRA